MESVMNQTIGNVAEVELVYKTKVKASVRPGIKCSKDSYDVLYGLWDKDKIELLEQFNVLFLNKGQKVLAFANISSGGIDSTVVDPRLIFTYALKINATSIVLCHNHPSCNLKPSRADVLVTEKMKNGGLLLDIKVLDHLIISNEGYYSFADEALL